VSDTDRFYFSVSIIYVCGYDDLYVVDSEETILKYSKDSLVGKELGLFPSIEK